MQNWPRGKDEERGIVLGKSLHCEAQARRKLYKEKYETKEGKKLRGHLRESVQRCRGVRKGQDSKVADPKSWGLRAFKESLRQGSRGKKEP